MDAHDVTVTILTGARPVLLEDTLLSVREHAPGLLETARVVALANGADGDTLQILGDHRDVIDAVDQTSRLLPIGPAVGRLLRTAARTDRTWWLHLEDDWRTHPEGEWLTAALRIFAVDPEVVQVRLRRADERVLPRHMVTREPIRWREAGWYRVAEDAHYTLNPSLVRMADARHAWPAAGERDAQRRWRGSGRRRVAQLLPGVFGHTGGDQSLRTETGATP